MDPAVWHDFDVAMAGATAALAGLVIVAASVNITRIVRINALTSRLASAIAALVLALTVTALGLVPDMSTSAYGWTVLVLALAVTYFPAHAARTIYRPQDPPETQRFLRSALGFLAPAAYVVAGVLLISDTTGALLAAAIACLLAIASALIVSWVVLVEVLR